MTFPLFPWKFHVSSPCARSRLAARSTKAQGNLTFGYQAGALGLFPVWGCGLGYTAFRVLGLRL